MNAPTIGGHPRTVSSMHGSGLPPVPPARSAPLFCSRSKRIAPAALSARSDEAPPEPEALLPMKQRIGVSACPLPRAAPLQCAGAVQASVSPPPIFRILQMLPYSGQRSRMKSSALRCQRSPRGSHRYVGYDPCVLHKGSHAPQAQLFCPAYCRYPFTFNLLSGAVPHITSFLLIAMLDGAFKNKI